MTKREVVKNTAKIFNIKQKDVSYRKRSMLEYQHTLFINIRGGEYFVHYHELKDEVSFNKASYFWGS